MEIDAAKLLGLMTRTVGVVDRDGKPAKLLVAGRAYPTSVEDLWDAVTSAERIPRWFLPITGQLRVAGRYQLEGNAGGDILECEPPRRFAITWEYGGDVSWVTVALTPDARGEETYLELRHVAHVPDEFWDEFGPGATGMGWELGLMGLDRYLATGAAVDPEEFHAWERTAAARAYIAAMSTAWADASIAGGTDPVAARAAADRATAAYTATEG
jgi:uncharacterized protein YndB with AHSA1/START domain